MSESATDHDWDDTHDSAEVSALKYVRKLTRASVDTTKKKHFAVTKSARQLKEDLTERSEPLVLTAFGSATNLSSGYSCFAEKSSALADRPQTRIVLNNLRWASKFFTCKGELLMNIADITEDYSFMFEAGVLHRDLSDGNIMQPQRLGRESNIWDLVSQTTEKLINLGHARATTVGKPVGKDQSSDKVESYTKFIRLVNIPITERAVAQAMKFVEPDDLMRYCRRAIVFDVLKSDKKGDRTAKDLGWNDVGNQPDFDSHALGIVRQSAAFHIGEMYSPDTIPFMSHQLITWSPDAHDAIHDMESLFWVLVHICLTRESGGRHRWKCLPDQLEEEPKSVGARNRREEERKKCSTLIEGIFYSSPNSISWQKRCHFNPESNNYFEYLLMHVHEYFDPLKDLLRRWRNVLVLGHTFRAYEYYLVHNYILKILGDALKFAGVQDEEKNAPGLAQQADVYKFSRNRVLDAQGGSTSSENIPPSASTAPSPILLSLASRAQVFQSASGVSRNVPSCAIALSAATMGSTPAVNHPRPSVSPPVPTPSRLPIVFPASDPLLYRPSSAVPASVPTTPKASPGGRTSESSNPTPTDPRQTPLSCWPKMPIPKKARKE